MKKALALIKRRNCILQQWTVILLLLLLLPCAALAQSAEAILVDEAPYAANYRCAVTPDGNTVIALGLRYEANRREGENPLTARLVCMGRDGKVLWEQKDDANDSMYVRPCALADGTVMAVYNLRSDGADGKAAGAYLRHFSAQGELLNEAPLSETAFYYIQTNSGMLITFLDQDKENQPVETLALYDASLAPVWTIDDMRCVFRFDSAYGVADGLLLLYRDSSAESNVDAVRLVKIDMTGRIVWSRQLSDQQMGYMSFRPDAEGNCIVYLGDLDWRQTSAGALYCFAPDGSEQWKRPITLPEMDGELCDFQLTEDGFLLMGEANTETSVRLYRFDMNGTLIGVTDHSIHEELALRSPSFAALGGKPYACVIEDWEDGDRYSTYLLALEIPQGR